MILDKSGVNIVAWYTHAKLYKNIFVLIHEINCDDHQTSNNIVFIYICLLEDQWVKFVIELLNWKLKQMMRNWCCKFGLLNSDKFLTFTGKQKQLGIFIGISWSVLILLHTTFFFDAHLQKYHIYLTVNPFI